MILFSNQVTLLTLSLVIISGKTKAHWHSHDGYDHDDYDFEPTNRYQQQQQQCQQTPTPFKTELSKFTLTYPFLDKGLSIFTDLQINCNGYILEWHFLSAATVIWGLHLGVFRPFAHNRDELALIHETYVNGMTTRSFGDTWAILKLDRPFKVQAGDMIGAFYDRNVTKVYGALSLRSMGRQINNGLDSLTDTQSMPFFAGLMNNAPYRPNTLLLFHTAEDLRQSSGVVNRNEAYMVERLPGLYVMLSGSLPTSSNPPMNNNNLNTGLSNSDNNQRSTNPHVLVPKTAIFNNNVNRMNYYSNDIMKKSSFLPMRNTMPEPAVDNMNRHETQNRMVPMPRRQEMIGGNQYYSIPKYSAQRVQQFDMLRHNVNVPSPEKIAVPKEPFFIDTTPEPRMFTKAMTTPRQIDSSMTLAPALLPATLAPFPALFNFNSDPNSNKHVAIPRKDFAYESQNKNSPSASDKTLPTVTAATSKSRCFSVPTYQNCANMMIRFYYDASADVCRQYLYCPTKLESDNIGFPSQVECVQICTNQNAGANLFSSNSNNNNHLMLDAFFRGPKQAKLPRVNTPPPIVVQPTDAARFDVPFEQAKTNNSVAPTYPNLRFQRKFTDRKQKFSNIDNRRLPSTDSQYQKNEPSSFSHDFSQVQLPTNFFSKTDSENLESRDFNNRVGDAKLVERKVSDKQAQASATSTNYDADYETAEDDDDDNYDDAEIAEDESGEATVKMDDDDDDDDDDDGEGDGDTEYNDENMDSDYNNDDFATEDDGEGVGSFVTPVFPFKLIRKKY